MVMQLRDDLGISLLDKHVPKYPFEVALKMMKEGATMYRDSLTQYKYYWDSMRVKGKDENGEIFRLTEDAYNFLISANDWMVKQ